MAGDLTWFEWLVVAIGLVSWIIQMVYLIFLFAKTVRYKAPTDGLDYPPVSVIICARNEERNLRELIPQLFDQEYPDFEVVAVNDASWDDSAEILKALQVRFPRLAVVSIDENKQQMKGKKFALTLGIKATKYEHLLLTDADCRPNSKKWIKEMAAGFQNDNNLVLGYSPYSKEKGLTNLLIRFDTSQIGLFYLSMALAGKPYMGVGRNMAYKKDLFFENGGFKSHYHIASGDDDLFVNQVASKNEVGVVFNESAHMVSIPASTYSAWWKQKRRHLTTAHHYAFNHKLILGLWPLSWFLFVITIMILFTININILLVIGALVIRYAVQMFIFSHSSKRMGDRDLTWLSPVAEAGVMLTNLFVYWVNAFYKPKQWK